MEPTQNAMQFLHIKVSLLLVRWLRVAAANPFMEKPFWNSHFECKRKKNEDHLEWASGFFLVRLWVSFIVIDLVGSARNPGFERFENTTEKWIQEFFLKYFEQEENSKWKAMNARLHIPPQSTENFFTYPNWTLFAQYLKRHLTYVTFRV